MSFTDLSYAFCVWPFEEALRVLYSVLYSLSGSYGVSLVLMSLCVTALITPFMRFASAAQMRERHIQDILGPQLKRIEAESAGAERQRRIQNLYRRYAYHPVYALRSALGVLIQVPLLLGAYYMLKNFGAIAGQPFLSVADLSRPDALFLGLNLLPVVMTGINMYSACVTPGFGGRETLQAWIIALLFLFVLYNAPSALLIFWTCNNFWGLLMNKRMCRLAGDPKTPSERFREALEIFPRVQIGPRFAGMAYMTLFLITLQSAVAFYLSRYDRKAALLVHALSFLLLVWSTILFLRGKRRSYRIAVTAIAWGSVLVLYFLMWTNYLKIHPETLNYLIDFRPTAHYLYDVWFVIGAIAHEFVHENIYIVQFLGAAALLLLSGKRRNGKMAVPASFYWILFFSVVLPASLQAVNNTDYLTIQTAWIYYGTFLSLAAVMFFVVPFLGRSLISREDAVKLAALFMFALLMNPAIQRYCSMYGGTAIVFTGTMLTTAIFVCQKKTEKWTVVILASSVSLMLLNGVFEHILLKPQTDLKEAAQSEVSVAIEEKERVSVFLLVYDAIPDLQTLEDLGVDAKPLADLLHGNGFKIYERTYTVAGASLTSMSRTFQITDASHLSVEQQQEMCAGNSATARIFSNNSYGTASIQSYYMVGTKIFTDEHWPPYKIGYEINNVYTLIRSVFAGEFRFDAGGWDERFGDLTYHDFLRNTMAAKQGPWFTFMHVSLPGHSQSSGKLLPNETELFVERMNTVLPRIEEDIRAILANKPSAVIIIIGDHGPYLTGDGADGRALNRYALKDISELMIRDRFGTLVAIRWPDPERAAKYDKDLLVNQDIFPVVFAYLADSPQPLDLMIKEKKAVLRGHAFLDSGVFIPAEYSESK